MDVTEQVKRIIGKELKVSLEKLTAETNLRNDLGVDSLSFVEIIMALEEFFKIEIQDDEAQSIATVGDTIKFVEMKTRESVKGG